MTPETQDTKDKYGLTAEAREWQASLPLGQMLFEEYGVVDDEINEKGTSPASVNYWRGFSGAVVSWWKGRLEKPTVDTRQITRNYLGLGKDKLTVRYNSDNGKESGTLGIFLDKEGGPDFDDEFTMECEVRGFEEDLEQKYEVQFTSGFIRQIKVTSYVGGETGVVVTDISAKDFYQFLLMEQGRVDSK